MATARALERTPLHECHAALGARLVEFAGWAMPVQYSSGIEEHLVVRRAAGLFDVSHMGEIVVSGAGASAWLEWLTPSRLSSLRPGEARYTALLTTDGTYIDDLLVYRFEHHYWLVVNAANTQAVLAWLQQQLVAGVEVRDASREIALVALQGPGAEEILRSLQLDVSRLAPFAFVEAELCGSDVTVSRTGYTGEDGFEIYLAWESAARVWNGLLDGGANAGLAPCGLGARDTLRLEAALALYGHEIDRSVTPFESRLGWTVDLKGADFVGREVLLALRERGFGSRLIGLELGGRRIARQGAPVFAGDAEVGSVTSGSWSPSLEKPIALARVSHRHSAAGGALEVGVRNRREAARVVRLPFYKRRGEEAASEGGATA
ncbi:MAG: glycine cleavage system aminomethyltransferase GcvT [Acidobacteriota bacterium]|nr:glycine cleavage system aminomethyltransferase GcvT [Acidobacteriota bacterium]